MGREMWSADGWVLTDGLVQDVEMRDGLYTIAGTRVTQGQLVLGRHGEMPGARRRYANTDFTLNLWLGADTDRSDVEETFDNLVRATAVQHRLVHYVRTLADGSERTIRGRLITAVQPSPIGNLGIRMGIEVNCPEVFWRDLSPTSFATSAGAALPQALTLDAFERCSGPMEDLLYTIHGPITNPQVTVTSDQDLNDNFLYAGTIGSGQSLIVDSGAWTVTGTGGLAPTLTKLSWTGDHILEIPPASPGSVPAVQLTGTGGGANTQLTVAGLGSYLI